MIDHQGRYVPPEVTAESVRRLRAFIGCRTVVLKAPGHPKSPGDDWRHVAGHEVYVHAGAPPAVVTVRFLSQDIPVFEHLAHLWQFQDPIVGAAREVGHEGERMPIKSITHTWHNARRVRITDTPPAYESPWLRAVGSLIYAADRLWFFSDSWQAALELIDATGWAFEPLEGAVGSSDKTQSATNATVAADPSSVAFTLSSGNVRVIRFGQKVLLTKAPMELAGHQGTFGAPRGGEARVLAYFRSDADGSTTTVLNLNDWDFEPIEPVAADLVTVDKTRRQQPFDEVQKPKHYNAHPSGIECIEIAERLGFNLGNALKYLWRGDHKHETPVKDLEKALWYLRRELSFVWEKSTDTRARLDLVLSHEGFTSGNAMLRILFAAASETGSADKRGEILEAIRFVEMELAKGGIP